MAQRHHVHGYENFVEYMKQFSKDQEIYVYFSGSKVPETNESWCDDCVRAWPKVESAISKHLDEKAHFVYVEVGPRDYWKNQACPFRTDKNIRILMLPSIVRWYGIQRLEGDQCEKPDLLELIFNDEC